MDKRCSKCGLSKPLSAFLQDKRDPGKYRASCKACKAEYAREWGARNRGRQNERMKAYRKENLDHFRDVETARRIRRHGLTSDQYRDLLSSQEGLCAICRKRAAICIDHDHQCCPGTYSCGSCVRGLLCHTCNRAIGLLGDDPETTQRVLKYLAPSY